MDERDQMALAIASILLHVGGEVVVTMDELDAAIGYSICGKTDEKTGLTRFWLERDEEAKTDDDDSGSEAAS